jgi:hypothetical protein
MVQWDAQKILGALAHFSKYSKERNASLMFVSRNSELHAAALHPNNRLTLAESRKSVFWQRRTKCVVQPLVLYSNL